MSVRGQIIAVQDNKLYFRNEFIFYYVNENKKVQVISIS